jgi:hypothetical protein
VTGASQPVALPAACLLSLKFFRGGAETHRKRL